MALSVDLIDQVLERDGGFVDPPANRGGPTNDSITLPTLARHLGRTASLAGLRALPKATAAIPQYFAGLNSVMRARRCGSIMDRGARFLNGRPRPLIMLDALAIFVLAPLIRSLLEAAKA